MKVFSPLLVPMDPRKCASRLSAVLKSTFSHILYFSSNMYQKVTKSHPFLKPKCIKSDYVKQAKKRAHFLSLFVSILAPFWEPWGTLGPPFGIKNVSIGPLGRPLLAPVGPKTPPGTPKTSILVNFGGLGKHFPPLFGCFSLHLAPFRRPFHSHNGIK